jgi:hypothetical protein
VEVREQYQVEITYRFAALETLSGDEDISRFGRVLKGISKHS